MTAGERTRAVRGVASAWALAMVAAACGDAFFFEPAPPTSAALALRLGAGEPAGSVAEAFDEADRLTVTLLDGSGGPVLTEVLDLAPGTDRTRTSVQVEVSGEQAELELVVVLGLGSAPLFAGERDVILRAGETTEAPVALEPVPAALLVPASLPDLTALGETVELEGRVTLATGDTIEGAEVTWTSGAPGIVAVEPVAGGGFRARAVAEGSAQLLATHEGRGPGGLPVLLEGRVGIAVGVRVERVVVDPARLVLEVEETGTLAAEARDRNDAPVPGRTFEWSASNADVASVDQEGVVTAVGPGTARVFAEVDGVSGFADVVVEAPPPDRPTGLSVAWNDGVRLSWADPSDGDASFRVERSVTPPPPPDGTPGAHQSSDFETIATLPPGTTSFRDPAPVPGELAYRVVACNATGCSLPTAPVRFDYHVAPTVQTREAADVTSHSATLIGTVDAHGLETFAYFEVDRSPSFSEPWILAVSPNGIVPADFGNRLVSAFPGDLPSGTLHHVRLVAYNEAGLTIGGVVTFETLPPGGAASQRER